MPAIKSKSQLAAEYGVCRKTMRKFMNAMPYTFTSPLTPPYIKAVYDEMGYYLDGVKASDWVDIRLPRKTENKGKTSGS